MIHEAPAKAKDEQPRKGGKHRQDQGRLARMAAFWLLVLLVLFGSNYLYQQLLGFDSLDDTLGGITIPVVRVPLTAAFLIATAVFAGGAIWVKVWLDRPKAADLLIESEAELRKVTWPTLQEVINSTMVVVVCVVLIGAFLAGADWLLGRLFRLFILGEV